MEATLAEVTLEVEVEILAEEECRKSQLKPWDCTVVGLKDLDSIYAYLLV